MTTMSDRQAALSVSPHPLGWLLRRRSGNLIGFLACAGLLAFGYYLQFVVGLEPCPLCIIQRLILLATGIAFLVAAVHHPVRRWAARSYGIVIALIALSGASVSARHVWIQHTPEALRPACGPGLDFLISTFGPFEVLQRVLRGSGECGTVDWTLLGLSIPEWTLGAFIVLGAWALFLSFRD
jgi:disulfide bond formation protein DsbB